MREAAARPVIVLEQVAIDHGKVGTAGRGGADTRNG
jgi:hypothetical protein